VSAIRKLLRTAVRDGQAPGLVAMAVNSDGVVHSATHGRRCMAERGRMTTDTVFRVSSLMKPLATVAALQLVDSGELDLDDRLDALLPELADGGADRDEPCQGRTALRTAERTRSRTVTLRSLLSHIADPTTLASDAEMTWTGRTVERVTGVGLDAYVQDNVLTPLDMADTHFRLPATLWNRTAGVHSEVAPGVIRATSFGTSEPTAHQRDQAVLYSTAPDTVKLLATLLRRDTTLLSGRAYQELGRIRPVKPTTQDVVVYRGLFNSHCWVDRRSDTAGVLFTQLVPHGHREVNVLFEAYHAAVRAEHRNRPSRTPTEAFLESFNFYRDGAVWWI
jgi:CubicO group peptidase (beta-lactamase class C family)